MMKLLALDTSTEIASVSLFIDGEILYQEQGVVKTHAQFLLPMIDQLLAEADISLGQLNGIVFGCGPGSFTGLRIACSMAKGLAYAHDLGLIPVSSLSSIAYELRQQKVYEQSSVLAVLDARMQQMYWSYFSKDDLADQAKVTAVEDIRLPKSEEGIVLAGLGIDLYWPAFPKQIQAQIIAKCSLYPNAASMTRLALATDIKPITAAAATPVYVRNQVTDGA